MSSLRTDKTEKLYEEYRKNGGLENGCRLCDAESMKEFKFWRIIPNKFPYDKFASRHDMIIPIRHVVEEDLTQEEKDELLKIKESDLIDKYRFIFEALKAYKTIPSHFHCHLMDID